MNISWIKKFLFFPIRLVWVEMLFPICLNAQGGDASFSLTNGLVQPNKDLNDGPYMFIENKVIVQKSIKDGEVVVNEVPVKTIETKYRPEPAIYKNVEFAAQRGGEQLAFRILQP